MEESLEAAKKDYSKGTSKTIFDISGLALKWDDSSVICQRMRNDFNLCVHYDSKTKKETNFAVARNVKNLKANQAVMVPVLHIIRSSGCIINIDRLAMEVTKVYKLNDKAIITKTAMDQAWSIRHLVGVLRRTIRTDKHDKSKKILPKDFGFKKMVRSSVVRVPYGIRVLYMNVCFYIAPKRWVLGTQASLESLPPVLLRTRSCLRCWKTLASSKRRRAVSRNDSRVSAQCPSRTVL